MRYGYRKLYLGGSLTDASDGGRRQVVCPGTEETVAEVAWATEADANEALASASAAFASWSRLSLTERAAWMHKLRDVTREREELLRECVMYEMGKPWDATAEDYQTVVNALAFYPEEMARLRGELLPDGEGRFEHSVVYEPLGVAVAMLAWNFPLLNLGFKIGPALAAGCTLVIKPSSQSPLSAYVFGEVCDEVGLPAGVVSILSGPNDTVGAALCASRITSLVTLIGSTQTGVRLVQTSATSIKRYSMELGGNAPVLVFEDADLARAVDAVAALKFGNAGQICVAPNRVLVHASVADAFVARIVEKAAAVRIGFGRDSGATMGPMISDGARRRVDALVQDALAGGAKLLCGGKIPDEPKKGFFYAPTVLRGVRPEMRIFREEIFGPVVGLIECGDDDEALRLANDTEAGLASYVFTRDGARARRASRELRFGEVQVNGFKYGIDLPHIGIGQSGVGCDCSHLALHDYLVRKRITVAV